MDSQDAILGLILLSWGLLTLVLELSYQNSKKKDKIKELQATIDILNLGK